MCTGMWLGPQNRSRCWFSRLSLHLFFFCFPGFLSGVMYVLAGCRSIILLLWFSIPFSQTIIAAHGCLCQRNIQNTGPATIQWIERWEDQGKRVCIQTLQGPCHWLGGKSVGWRSRCCWNFIYWKFWLYLVDLIRKGTEKCIVQRCNRHVSCACVASLAPQSPEERLDEKEIHRALAVLELVAPPIGEDDIVVESNMLQDNNNE